MAKEEPDRQKYMGMEGKAKGRIKRGRDGQDTVAKGRIA